MPNAYLQRFGRYLQFYVWGLGVYCLYTGELRYQNDTHIIFLEHAHLELSKAHSDKISLLMNIIR